MLTECKIVLLDAVGFAGGRICGLVTSTGAADWCIGPSAREKRGLQDDKTLRKFVYDE